MSKLASYAGGTENLKDIFQDAMDANGHSDGTMTFDNRAGNAKPAECNGGFACWDYKHDTIVLSDYIFTKAYQDSKWRPQELGLFHNLSAGIEVTMIHEMSHVFADARPAASKIYSWRVPIAGTDPEERMANAIAFYVVSGMQTWPGHESPFDFVQEFDSLWYATP